MRELPMETSAGRSAPFFVGCHCAAIFGYRLASVCVLRTGSTLRIFQLPLAQ
jgi:hypothetical protein